MTTVGREWTIRTIELALIQAIAKKEWLLCHGSRHAEIMAADKEIESLIGITMQKRGLQPSPQLQLEEPV